MAGRICDLIDHPPTVTWPTFCVDGTWVDFDAAEYGYRGHDDPLHTMNDTLSPTAPGVKLHVKPGTSNWSGTLSTRMRLEAPFGLATIGQ